MLILAFETSGPTASVALMRDGIQLCEHAVHHTRTHSETVLPMAERVLCEMEFSPDMLGAVCVNCGPGSFTGVRIGVATANAMAAALDIPVVGVNSLAALYENICVYPGHACILIDARNDSVYAAQFAGGVMAGVPAASPVIEYISGLPENTLFAGDGAVVYRDAIQKILPSAVFAPPTCALSRAGALCRIANERLMLDPAAHNCRQVEPLYLRPSQAERLWLQKEGKEHAT